MRDSGEKSLQCQVMGGCYYTGAIYVFFQWFTWAYQLYTAYIGGLHGVVQLLQGRKRCQSDSKSQTLHLAVLVSEGDLLGTGGTEALGWSRSISYGCGQVIYTMTAQGPDGCAKEDTT